MGENNIDIIKKERVERNYNYIKEELAMFGIYSESWEEKIFIEKMCNTENITKYLDDLEKNIKYENGYNLDEYYYYKVTHITLLEYEIMENYHKLVNSKLHTFKKYAYGNGLIKTICGLREYVKEDIKSQENYIKEKAISIIKELERRRNFLIEEYKKYPSKCEEIKLIENLYKDAYKLRKKISEFDLYKGEYKYLLSALDSFLVSVFKDYKLDKIKCLFNPKIEVIRLQPYDFDRYYIYYITIVWLYIYFLIDRLFEPFCNKFFPVLELNKQDIKNQLSKYRLYFYDRRLYDLIFTLEVLDKEKTDYITYKKRGIINNDSEFSFNKEECIEQILKLNDYIKYSNLIKISKKQYIKYTDTILKILNEETENQSDSTISTLENINGEIQTEKEKLSESNFISYLYNQIFLHLYIRDVIYKQIMFYEHKKDNILSKCINYIDDYTYNSLKSIFNEIINNNYFTSDSKIDITFHTMYAI